MQLLPLCKIKYLLKHHASALIEDTKCFPVKTICYELHHLSLIDKPFFLCDILYEIYDLRNKTCSPLLHSLVKTEANGWENSRAD